MEHNTACTVRIAYAATVSFREQISADVEAVYGISYPFGTRPLMSDTAGSCSNEFSQCRPGYSSGRSCDCHLSVAPKQTRALSISVATPG